MSKKLIWHTEKRRVKDLVPYAKNPRLITDNQMHVLEESLKDFEYVELVAINLDGTIIVGHQRVEAMKRLGRGEEEIEVRVPNRQLTEKEFKAYLLISNRSGGTFDWDILKTDFDDIELLLGSGFDSGDLDRKSVV